MREAAVLDSGVARDSLRADAVRDSVREVVVRGSVREGVVLDWVPREVAMWLSGVTRFDVLRVSDRGAVLSVGAVRAVVADRVVSCAEVRSEVDVLPGLRPCSAGLATASVCGCPPFTFAYEVRSARAACTCCNCTAVAGV